MITVAINTTPISPHRHAYDTCDAADLARLASEVAERIDEMNEKRMGAGTDFVMRLAGVARLDRGAFALIVSVLHGQVETILDSYSAKGDKAGREKQTMHYRILRELDTLHEVFPEAAHVLNQIRESVKHHEDPQSRADAVREACE